MNPQKAREFFSAYYEGTLDNGLRQQLEARFQADPKLRSDYAAFAETMESLNEMQFEEVEVPLFLNDRIATRLEQEEIRRSQSTFAWFQRLRGFALAGLATAAIVAGVFAIRGNSPVATAAIVGFDAEATYLPVNRLTFSSSPLGVQVAFRSTGQATVTVSNGMNGEVLQRYPVSDSEVRTTLENPNVAPALLKVTAGGDAPAMIALPGKTKQSAASGTGSVAEFAIALSGKYAVPVVIRGTTTEDVTWRFEAGSARKAAESALMGSPYSVDQREGGLIVLVGR